uniref:Uncharacterized protein n=1 Tax=Arundo donax TaxID=35708 RepID=A0A0A8ZXM5_ARUDO
MAAGSRTQLSPQAAPFFPCSTPSSLPCAASAAPGM